MKTIQALFFLFATVLAFGQTTNNCNAILQHGLRNVNISMSSEASIARKYENHCDKDYSLLTDEQVGSIEAEVFGYGGGEGSYSRREREERLREWCKTNEQEAKANKESLVQSSIIYGRAYEAYEKCLELQADKIQFNYQPSEDFKTININMQYTSPTISDGIFLTGVETEGFTYEIKTVDKEGIIVKKYSSLPDTPIYINNLATNILFKREPSVLVKEGNQTYNKVPRGSITIQTSGKSLMLSYPEEYKPTIPAQRAIELQSQIDNLNMQIEEVGIDGVASVIASLLTEKKFKELYDRNGQEWVLAMGQTVSTNSKYYEYTNTNELPDLRGRFLRGKNYSRSKSSGNVDGDLALADGQDDTFKSHSHRIYGNKFPASTSNTNGIISVDVLKSYLENFSDPVDATFTLNENNQNKESTETRPRNITVNFFIRIN